MNRLRSDYKYCENIIKKHSKSFYYAFSNLDSKDRNAVYAIYAFCRIADDAVDNAATYKEKIENHKQIRYELDCFAHHNVPDSPIWRALNDVRDHYQLNLNKMYQQLDGQEMDIHFTQPQTLYDLEHYSSHVAGSVGLILLPIICDKLSDARESRANCLGVAMQYTNVLRDIGEDLKDLNRIYIPKELMDKHQVTYQQLASKQVTPEFIRLWEEIACIAEEKYEDFLNEIVHYKHEAQLGLILSVLIYREILNEVRRNHYNCLSQRQVVSLARKAKIKRDAEKLLKSMREGNTFG